ncbi:hypothetical protein O3M35_004376 [Rhynocoris fuscipes]|uniref:Uncharacterized protein n=1 Tax=Rhynocoris fuscipes TaxID=488301 RepID=A0AAW1CLK7_9HEMI
MLDNKKRRRDRGMFVGCKGKAMSERERKLGNIGLLGTNNRRAKTWDICRQNDGAITAPPAAPAPPAPPAADAD